MARIRWRSTTRSRRTRDDRERARERHRRPPRGARWGGKRTVVPRSREELLARAANVFDAGLRQSIIAAKPDDLWANWQCVMFDSGRVWSGAAENSTLRIITNNAPTPAQEARR